jgi:hypothetical protein
MNKKKRVQEELEEYEDQARIQDALKEYEDKANEV